MLPLLLTLIFARPFICSLAFPYANYFYSLFFAAFLCAWVIFKKTSLKNLKALPYPVVLFSLALIISVLYSRNNINSLSELYKYVTGLLLLIISASLADKDKKYIIRIITLSGLVISFLAIYQYFFGFKHVLQYLAGHKISSSFMLDYLQRKRVFFPFVTPNILAGYLAVVIPLAFLNKYKILILAPLLAALFLTKSLGGLFSAFLALAVFFYLEGKVVKKKFFFLAGLLLIVGLVFGLRMATQKEHTHPLFSSTMRLSYWKDALGIIKSSPLTGVGLGNFNLPQSRYAHNSYLQIWAEMGILGLLSFLWLVASVFKFAWGKIKTSLNAKQEAALGAAAVAFLAHNFIDFSFFLPEVSLIWWALLGMLL